MSARRLFHLVPAEAWEEHAASGRARWDPPSLPTEGFVHLSFADQLQGTLDAHFAGVGSVVLIEVDPGRLGPALVLERSRGGDLFPHLRRGLDARDLLRCWQLDRAADRIAPPRLGEAPGDDVPLGTDVR